MIQFGLLPNGRAAQALIDYLKGLNIPCQASPDAGGFALFVLNPQDLERATQELEYFVNNANDSKYLKASWDNGSTSVKLDYGHPSSQLLKEFLTGCGPLTLGIFISCVVIFVAWNLGYANAIYDKLGFFGTDSSEGLSQFWRVFTPSLLHFSAMHLIFNLLWWWYLGGKIEKKLGFTPLFTLLIVGGTLPNIVQFMMTGPNFGGLSGVVYSVVGYSWIMGLKKPSSGIFLPNAYMGFMMIWLVLGFTDVFGLSIANGAHIGGLLVGLAQGLFDSRKK